MLDLRGINFYLNAGGICIANEVQIGFGCMRAHFGGFETNSVLPDIVTLGKSMGNGIPCLLRKYPIIGNVCGRGLFISVELVRDLETLEPETTEADLL